MWLSWPILPPEITLSHSAKVHRPEGDNPLAYLGCCLPIAAVNRRYDSGGVGSRATR